MSDLLANLRPRFDAELARLLPTVEDELLRMPCRNRRLVNYLREEASITGMDVNYLALGGDERFNNPNLRASMPEFWQHLAQEKDAGIPEVVWLWQKHAIYKHWLNVFSCPDPHVLLEKLLE